MVPRLPVPDQCKRRLRVDGPLGEDRQQQHLDLRDGQFRGLCFTLRCVRTSKKWARIQSVIC
jgi:hypothetical protein